MEYLKQLENKNPKAFAKLISTPEDPQTGYTPVHTAVSMNNTEALKFIAETAPDEFKKNSGYEGKKHIISCLSGCFKR